MSDHCEICGELFKDSDEIAEMATPEVEGESYICHAQCGLDKGLEIA